MDNLMKAKSATKSKTKRSISTSMSTESKTNKEVPKDATIISKNIRTETEEIENGFLITKTYDINYRAKGSEHTDYCYYSKKWYCKEDPFQVDLKDKSLSDVFDDDVS